MQIEIDKHLFLFIEGHSFESLSTKLDQRDALRKFKNAHSNRFNKLTPREKEIFTLLAKGSNNPQVASSLDISRRTVETHRKKINRKLEIKHYRDVLKYAIAFDLVKI